MYTILAKIVLFITGVVLVGAGVVVVVVVGDEMDTTSDKVFTQNDGTFWTKVVLEDIIEEIKILKKELVSIAISGWSV